VATLGTFGPDTPEEQLYRIVDVLEAIAGEVDRTVAQVAIGWVLRRPTVATVVMGARDEAQLRANVAAVDLRLSDDQVRRLDEVSARPPIYPYWHQREIFGARNPPPV